MKQQGFTLIELIVVIVILGILSVVAAPRFMDITDDARAATFKATAGAFKEGVNQVHYAWLIRGEGVAQADFITINDAAAGGDLNVNAAGYPADTRGNSLTLNSEDDCLDVWRAVLDSNDFDVAGDNSAVVQAEYNDPNACTFTLVADSNLSVTYDSNTGAVAINF